MGWVRGLVDSRALPFRLVSLSSIPMGMRLAWTMVALPGAVRRAPVIDMAVFHWIASSHFIIMRGPVSVRFLSVLCEDFVRNQRSAV